MRPSRRFLCGALLAAAPLAACKLPTAPDDAQAFARTIFRQIQAGDWKALKAAMPPDLAQRTGAAQLEPMKAMLPAGEPKAVRLQGWRVNVGTGGEQIGLDQAYDFEGRTVGFHTDLQRLGPGRFLLTGFNIDMAPGAQPPPPPPLPRRREAQPKSDLKTI